MKKIGLLTTLLVAGLLLAGCNNSSKDGADHTEGKSYSEAVQICEDNDGEVTTDEMGNNICLLNALDWCLIEKIQNGTCEYICEGDDCDIPDDFEDCEHYYDGCNRCTLQEDGAFVCTEEACEVYQEAYCGDDLYEKYLEDIKKSGAEPQRINDYPEESEVIEINNTGDIKLDPVGNEDYNTLDRYFRCTGYRNDYTDECEDNAMQTVEISSAEYELEEI